MPKLSAKSRKLDMTCVLDGVNSGRIVITALATLVAGLLPAATTGQESLTIDHYVAVTSMVPSIEGQVARLYVRERVLPGIALRSHGMEDRVVVFVHGAGTPAEVAFDAPGASWMEYLANAGYDTFSMDMTGYGRSTRPTAMNDPCNLSRSQQEDLVPVLLEAPCDPSYGFSITTIESDWNDLDAVVDYIRATRQVERVHLVAWSLGGPRAGGYAARHPDKVSSLTLLSPAYSRNRQTERPASAPGPAMTKQSHADLVALWNRQTPCEGQYDPEILDSVWKAMLESDPVGATWGTGVRRAPRVTTWGWNRSEVSQQQTPMLLVAPATDGQVSPERVVELFDDVGSSKKILLDLACSSHNAMWEMNRDLLFQASLEWLSEGTVEGVESGKISLGR